MSKQVPEGSDSRAEPRPGRPAGLRRDELALAAALLAAVALCYASGAGFEGPTVFGQYLAYFGRHGLYLFAIAKLAHQARIHWRPDGPLGRAVLRGLGGPAEARDLAAVDLEFLRGFLLVLVTITIYTNLKVRIPLLHGAVGDDLFQALDDLLLPEGLVPWLEQLAADDLAWARRLDKIYNHGFIWMILLVGWFWIRTDGRRMRWLFSSFGLLYMVCIFVTLTYPSYGPFFLDWQRFRWAEGTSSGYLQKSLVAVYLETLNAREAGRPIPAAAFHGIAAFPSLHVGFMVLMSVVGWSTARLFAVLMIGVALATTVATLVFGWHYLVDAFGGAVLAIAVPLAVRPWIFGRSAPAHVEGPPPSVATRQ